MLAYAVSPLIAQRQTVITQLKQQAKEPGLAATLVFSKLKGDLISLESRIQRCFEQASDDVRAAAAHAAAWGTNINVNPQAMRQAVGEEIGKAFASFAGGVVEGVSDTVTGTWNLATHPQSVVNLVRAFEADGPGTLKKMWDGIIDAETWQKDPARAMGKIAPGIIATILTAGGSGAVLAAGKATGKIEKAASAVDIADYARPSNFRSGVRDQVWVQNSDTKGIVRDPVTKRVMQKDQPWDMGHKEGYEFWKHQLSAQQRKIDRPQFLDEHNNPLHYRPELPGSNRSHRGEDPSDSYFGP
ncbi:HNH/ENDO VII family nuclease [Pseudarthrobacter sp. J47]|uniref:HNH/ENDO VII family nuclease n=1 Tax=Pseudarthrobacter sp. J47 TaxID=3116482 RepID=UPI002E803113|nr:HNH/ENDO VII family nuclease [Pseudarthrobacter sp. J47]MEE2524327.1 HNH/ENDO VII family nuclease [Pseudarthrobacter sp. J47]